MSQAPRIGILGGTFDPIHFGHLEAASAARQALSLDRILLLPARTPPHRSTEPRASVYHRFAMIALAASSLEDMVASDIELRRELWRYIRMLHSRGTTILLTTHYLEEAEALCEDIALIAGGEIVARSTPEGLKQQFGVRTLEDVYLRAVHEPREAVA